MKKGPARLPVVGLALGTLIGCGTVAPGPRDPHHHSAPSAVTTSPWRLKVASNVILDIRMFSAETGWLLTEGALYHTGDGGTTWNRVRMPFSGGQLESLVTTSGPSVWITELAKHGVAKVFTTRDGGVQWIGGGTLPQGTELVAAAGVGGWARPSPALLVNQYAPARALYRSDNHGQHWSTIPLHGALVARQALELGRVTFVNTDLGFVFGQSPVNGVAMFFRTTDGGRTWSPIRLRIPRNQVHATITVMRPRFFSHTGVLLVYFSTPHRQTAVIYRSQAEGQSWRACGTALSFQLNPDGFIGNCGSATACAVVSNGSRVWWTHNGGHTWSATPLPAAIQNVRQIDLVSQHVGWVAGLSHLWKTTDGGQTWHAVTINGP